MTSGVDSMSPVDSRPSTPWRESNSTTISRTPRSVSGGESLSSSNEFSKILLPSETTRAAKAKLQSSRSLHGKPAMKGNALSNQYEPFTMDRKSNRDLFPGQSNSVASSESIYTRATSAPRFSTELESLDDMIEVLTITHAMKNALKFPTMSLDEADELKREYEQAVTSIDDMRERIRSEAYNQRALVSLLRIADPSQEEAAVAWRTSSSAMTTLADELALRIKTTLGTQQQWLQHIAGTLATAFERHKQTKAQPDKISKAADEALSQLVRRLYTLKNTRTSGSPDRTETPFSLASPDQPKAFEHNIKQGHALVDAIDRHLASSPPTQHSSVRDVLSVDTGRLQSALDNEKRHRETLADEVASLRREVASLKAERTTWTRERQAVMETCRSVLGNQISNPVDAVERLAVRSGSTSQVDMTRLQSKLKQQEAVLSEAQKEFTQRESAFLLQSASMEAELEHVLKEYDRLTRSITDSNVETRRYEDRLLEQRREVDRLGKALADRTIQNLAPDGQTKTLRNEFRQLMANVKTEHQQAIEHEVQERQKVEQALRDLKRDMETKIWDQVNKGTQTQFVAQDCLMI